MSWKMDRLPHQCHIITNGTVDMSMPGYVEKTLNRFAHSPPTKPEDSPHHAEPIIYGQKTQCTKDHDAIILVNSEITELILI